MNAQAQRSMDLRNNRQTGAALVITAAVLTTIMAFAVLVAGRSSVNEMKGSFNGSDALQALLSAETALQRASKRYSQGLAACGAALNETVVYPAASSTNPPSVSTVITAATKGFDGTTDLSDLTNQCRITATATVTRSNITRKISQIVDKTLFDVSSANLDFNTLSGTVPADWVFSGDSDSSMFSREHGGYDGTPCNASAFLRKTLPNTNRYTAADYPKIRFNAFKGLQTNFTITFRRRYIMESGNDNDVNNNVAFRLTDSASSSVSVTANLGGRNGTTTIPTSDPPFSPCSTNYAGSTTTTGNIPIPASVTNPITTVGLTINVRGASTSDKEVYVDNLVINAPTLASAAIVTAGGGGTYLRILKWRECTPRSVGTIMCG